jgi:hypothetical protein
MLRNLYKTWSQLASNEVTLDQWGWLWTKNRHGASLRVEPREDGSLLPYEKYILQGYIQQCIHARGWYFSLEQLLDYCKADVRTKSEDQLHQCVKYKDACYEVLLTAYLTALAAQRPATAGVWQHFKGDEVEVVGLYPFGTRDCDDNDHTEEGLFTFEDDPTLSFQLLCWGDGHMEFQHTALSLGFLPDRVAYWHDGKGFLRTHENFLSLVGSEYPEQEGLLRFVHVR